MQKVTINGVEYTPFESGKNAKELGIDLSRKFIVVKNCSGKNYFQNGDIISYKDKGSNPTSNYFTGGSVPDCLMYWSELAYYDEPVKPKFKVGDKVKIIRKYNVVMATWVSDMNREIGKNAVITKMHGDDICELKIDEGVTPISWNWSVECLELVQSFKPIKATPIRDTIITNIKDEAQHRRVREKLFEMGLKEGGVDGDVFKEYGSKSIWRVFNDGTFQQYGEYAEDPEYKHITADEFLGEESPKTMTEVMMEENNRIYTQQRIEQYKRDGLKITTEYLIKKINNTPTDTLKPIVKGNKIMSIVSNAFKSKENKALEYFNLGTSDKLNEDGRREFLDYIYETGDTTKKGFLAKIVEAYKEEKK